MRGLTLIGVVAFGFGSLASAQDAGPARIFFDWGKAEIRPDAEQILDAAARGWSSGQRVELDGFSDRSGPSSSNDRLTRLRLTAVRDRLVAHGIPSSAITTRSHGERTPLVATEDGVREVQNRRVEVRFRP